MLVDLPGYGYAAAAKSKVTAWTRLIHDYLHGRAALGRVYVLIDARHGLKAVDEAILDTLGEAAVSYQIVLTKCDEVSEAELATRCESAKAAMPKTAGSFSRSDRDLGANRSRHPATARSDCAAAEGTPPVNALSLEPSRGYIHCAKCTPPNAGRLMQ